MTLIYLARHAETQFNVEGRLQGRSDSPLTGNGIRQAGQLRERLAAVPLVACYASPSPRAIATAQAAIAGRDVPLHLDERLYEMAMGEWEGVAFAELERLYPDLITRFRTYEATFRAPGGGETPPEVQRRMADALTEIARAHEGGPVLVVSHGVAVRMLLGYCVGPDVGLHTLPRTRNCALSILDWDGPRGRIELHGCERHLDPLPLG